MIGTDTIAYIAGIFDGEGSLHIKRSPEKKKKHKGKGYRMTNAMRISMEIAMTDEYLIRWIHDVLKVGTVIRRDVKGFNVKGKKYKTQWRWRCTFRDTLFVCKLLWPYVQVKLHKVEQVIDHYDANKPDRKNVVDLDTYRRTSARSKR
jgi:hypothetical protein